MTTPTTTGPSMPNDWPADALPEKWIERLFEHLGLEYGKKFSDQWGGTSPDALKRHWGRRLYGLRGEELKRGCDALAARLWPPTLPEFILLCRPALDPLVAYYEAIAGMQEREVGNVGKWSSPAIYWAAVKVSAFDLKNMSYSQIKTRWEQALREQVELGKLPDIPEPVLALPAPGKAELSKEEASKMLEELKANEVIKPLEYATEHRRWAHKIIERHKAGDQSLPYISLRFARETLGIEP